MTAVDALLAAEPPLTARSVLLSTLLGTEPPELAVARLVDVAELFGFSEGTARTSITRMTQRGDLVAVRPGRYALGPSLRSRQERQVASRNAEQLDWDGSWTVAVTTSATRSPNQRRQLRADLASLRLAPLRDGVHLRPDNLPSHAGAAVRSRIENECTWMRAQLHHDDLTLVAALWDIDGWVDRATALRAAMAEIVPRLDDEDLGALAPGFVLSAASLRHFQSDPLLPRELLGRTWNGPALRRDYDRFDSAYRTLLGHWWRARADRAWA